MKRNLLATAAAAAAIIFSQQVAADQVILDDLIVDGSICTGMDCVNGESFGFDTIRLKENNLRIRFVDTSTTASFPSRDWQITANDSANGGLNKFSIEDIDAGSTPFTVEGSAPSHSLYVDDGGRIGVGTSTPVVQIHNKDGNTPTLRLEQDGSSGFTPQTWDVAGNEANFFIRDATNGSTLPFRIQPGAPSSALSIMSDRKVGIGTWSPSSALHVYRNDGNARLTIEETSGSTSNRNLLTIVNNGQTTLSIENTNAAVGQWRLSAADDGSFFIQNPDIGGTTKEFEIKSNGDIYVAGAVVHSSDRNLKEGITGTDGVETLSKLVSLPIATWNYKSDPQAITHMGPMAQDFHAAFGLGVDDKHIATLDFTGVAFSAIQGLYQVVQEKDAQINELNSRMQRLEAQQQARLDGIEKAVSLLLSNKGVVSKTSVYSTAPTANDL